DVRTRHFQILPGAEVRLKVVYGVKPDELGCFLLELDQKLGTRSDRDKPPGSFDGPVFTVSEAGGWIRVSLTRLHFPAICCDCVTATNHRREFRGHRSLPADDWVRLQVRSEERRVGKECRSGWSPDD